MGIANRQRAEAFLQAQRADRLAADGQFVAAFSLMPPAKRALLRGRPAASTSAGGGGGLFATEPLRRGGAALVQPRASLLCLSDGALACAEAIGTRWEPWLGVMREARYDPPNARLILLQALLGMQLASIGQLPGPDAAARAAGAAGAAAAAAAAGAAAATRQLWAPYLARLPVSYENVTVFGTPRATLREWLGPSSFVCHLCESGPYAVQQALRRRGLPAETAAPAATAAAAAATAAAAGGDGGVHGVAEALLARVAQHREACAPISAALPPPRVAWALNVVWTRQFSGSTLMTADAVAAAPCCLVPWGDTLNHATVPNTEWGYSPSGDFVLLADRTVGAGEELFDSYGSKGALEFLTQYGFIPAGAELNFVYLPLLEGGGGGGGGGGEGEGEGEGEGGGAGVYYYSNLAPRYFEHCDAAATERLILMGPGVTPGFTAAGHTLRAPPGSSVGASAGGGAMPITEAPARVLLEWLQGFLAHEAIALLSAAGLSPDGTAPQVPTRVLDKVRVKQQVREIRGECILRWSTTSACLTPRETALALCRRCNAVLRLFGQARAPAATGGAHHALRSAAARLRELEVSLLRTWSAALCRAAAAL